MSGFDEYVRQACGSIGRYFTSEDTHIAKFKEDQIHSICDVRAKDGMCMLNVKHATQLVHIKSSRPLTEIEVTCDGESITTLSLIGVSKLNWTYTLAYPITLVQSVEPYTVRLVPMEKGVQFDGAIGILEDPRVTQQLCSILQTQPRLNPIVEQIIPGENTINISQVVNSCIGFMICGSQPIMNIVSVLITLDGYSKSLVLHRVDDHAVYASIDGNPHSLNTTNPPNFKTLPNLSRCSRPSLSIRSANTMTVHIQATCVNILQTSEKNIAELVYSYN
jgi:hypothetical protein